MIASVPKPNISISTVVRLVRCSTWLSESMRGSTARSMAARHASQPAAWG